MNLFTARLINCEFLFDNVRRLWLEVPDTFHYQAGQYLYLVLANGEERPYSIANAPHGNLLEFHIHYHEGDNAFTHALFQELLETKTIQFHGPHGHCTYPVPAPHTWILLAGGTGLAPCKALIEEVIAREHTFPVHLYWGVRSPQHLYLDALLKKYQRQHSWLHYTPVLFTEPEHAQNDRYGFTYVAAHEDFPSLHQTQIFVSGPSAMVYAAQTYLIDHGLPPQNFYSDYTESIR